MLTIESMSIHGFKSIAAVDDLSLGPISIVIGANGAGKSNLLSVFDLLDVCDNGRLEEYVRQVGGANKLLHFGAKHTARLTIRIRWSDWNWNESRELIPTADDSLLRVVANTGFTSLSTATADRVWRRYHFHDTGATSPMKRTADVHDNRHLREDGSNLAPFLYLLRERHRESYELIRSAVQRVAPFFDDFQLEPLRLNPEKMLLEWRHKGTDAYFSASSFSDGTLRFIALATLFLQPVELRPSVILVDEPELGLHPYAIALLASLAKQASAQTQVILCTQSPLLLDHFEPEDVLVAERKDGATTFERLSSERLASWLEEYSLGQLWEKNEIGGRPSAE